MKGALTSAPKSENTRKGAQRGAQKMENTGFGAQTGAPKSPNMKKESQTSAYKSGNKWLGAHTSSLCQLYVHWLPKDCGGGVGQLSCWQNALPSRREPDTI